jgi:hypothetical protein
MLSLFRGIRISEAGVAGDIELPDIICCTLGWLFCVVRYGDFLTELDDGNGGGAMSERCSGEMELFSEDDSLPLLRISGEAGDVLFDCSAGSTSSDSASADIVVLVIFLLCGFTTGDWRTARFGRGLVGAFLPAPPREGFLLLVPEEFAGGGRMSRFISDGEVADDSAREVA